MINSFKQYIVEEAKTLYFTFGRMNPPTVGHEKLLEVLSDKSGKNPYRVYLSQTIDKKKNPLAYIDKLKAARKMFPKHSRFILLNKDIKTIFDAANAIYNEGFTSIVMVVGSDRITEFQSLLTKYNGKTGQRYGFYKFKSIEVVSAGQRDPDSEGVAGMSSSKMKEAASTNDFAGFTKGLPKNFTNKDSKDLFNAVRSGMGLKEETEFYKHVQLKSVSDIREQYVQGEIYNISDRVSIKDTGDLAEVTFRGPNYLILEKEDGNTVRKWIDAVESIDEAVKKATGPKWKRSGPNGEKEITFSSGRRFQLEKQYDQNERHAGEWKVMEWNTRSRDWDWHETYSPQWHAKDKVMELGKYDSKGKKVTESVESVDESYVLGLGTPEATKKWVDTTPGQNMPPVKSTKTKKNKTSNRRHPGSDVADAGGMGEGAMKRSVGGSKADISYDRIDKGLRTFIKKPKDAEIQKPNSISKALAAKDRVKKILLKGSTHGK